MNQNEPYQPHKINPFTIIITSFIHIVLYLIPGVILNFLYPLLFPYWSVVFAGYICEVLAYTTHFVGHRRWISWWYNAHMGHHISDYPPNKFLSADYQYAKINNGKAYYFTMLMTPIITMWYLNAWFASVWLTGFLTSIILLFLADCLHKEFHIRGSRLEKYQWFMDLRCLHYYHHKNDMNKNYGIADFFFDFLTFHVLL